MDLYKLNYLEIKNDYLSLKNNLELQNYHGGKKGKKKEKKELKESKSYKKFIKLANDIIYGEFDITPENIDKLRDYVEDMKNEYHKAKNTILPDWEKDINKQIKKVTLKSCMESYIRDKNTGVKFPDTWYRVYFLYPYVHEFAYYVYEEINNSAKDKNIIGKIKTKLSIIEDINSNLIGVNKKNKKKDIQGILGWEMFSEKALIDGKLDFTNKMFYVYKQIEKIGYKQKKPLDVKLEAKIERELRHKKTKKK